MSRVVHDSALPRIMGQINTLWILLDTNNCIVHHSFSETDVPLMQRYVEQAVSAGDNWRIVKFVMVREETAVNGGNHG